MSNNLVVRLDVIFQQFKGSDGVPEYSAKLNGSYLSCQGLDFEQAQQVVFDKMRELTLLTFEALAESKTKNFPHQAKPV